MNNFSNKPHIMIVHNNARTNKYQRIEIQESGEHVTDLARKYCVSANTIRKWRGRDFVKDKTSRPNRINYTLTEGEQDLLVALRKMTWLPADDIIDFVEELIPEAGHSNVCRTYQRRGVSKVPVQEKEKRKKFKEYDPGYLHIDVTYIPKLEGKKKYIFVAIDRATRLVYISLKDNRDKQCSKQFLEECLKFFPFKIEKILTDNGSEFTNEYYRKNNKRIKRPEKHLFVKTCEERGIEHRKTRVKSPWTNGLVERFNRTLKDNTIHRYRYKDYKELEKSIKSFEMRYNIFIKHKSIKRRTPYEVTCEWYDKRPKLFKFNPKGLLTFYNLQQRGDI